VWLADAVDVARACSRMRSVLRRVVMRDVCCCSRLCFLNPCYRHRPHIHVLVLTYLIARSRSESCVTIAITISNSALILILVPDHKLQYLNFQSKDKSRYRGSKVKLCCWLTRQRHAHMSCHAAYVGAHTVSSAQG
jgi:hypothetical protein